MKRKRRSMIAAVRYAYDYIFDQERVMSNETLENIQKNDVKVHTNEHMSLKEQVSFSDMEADKEIKVSIDKNSEEKILEELSDLHSRIDQMQELFEDKIQRSEADENIIRKMQSELKIYRNGMILKPILLDMINIREKMDKVIKNFEKKGVDGAVINIAEELMDDMNKILNENGVTIYRGEAGMEFIPIKQTILDSVVTSQKELHKKVKESLSSGYELNGKILFPERVIAYTFYSEK